MTRATVTQIALESVYLVDSLIKASLHNTYWPVNKINWSRTSGPGDSLCFLYISAKNGHTSTKIRSYFVRKGVTVSCL